MKLFTRIIILALIGVAPMTALQAQGTSPAAKADKSAATANPNRTDVYHVFFVKAAPGKAKELADFLKEPDPNMPDAKGIILRHQDGDEWDYVAIEHMGPKATVESAGTPMPPSKRGLMESHNDTFVSGPSWAEFAKQMGLDDAAKTAGAVYSVSDYRPVPGHRDDLDKMLSEPPNRAIDTSSGAVLLQHVEGASWTFLSVVRYDSWEKFAENEKNSIAETKKNQGGWFDLRNHVATHHDTLTDRILP